MSQAILRLADKFLEMWAAAVEQEAAQEGEMDDQARRRLGRFFR
jgi:hypothetical protein